MARRIRRREKLTLVQKYQLQIGQSKKQKEDNSTRKGWCPWTGKGQRFMGKEVVNGNISGSV